MRRAVGRPGRAAATACSASSTRASPGAPSAPLRTAATTCRHGRSARSTRTATAGSAPPYSAAMAILGTSATPIPAATRARIEGQSAAACACSGTNPAAWHATVVISDQGPLLP